VVDARSRPVLSERLAALSPEERAALAATMRRRQAEARARGIPRAARTGPAPLSFAQQRIWFLEQWEPGGFTHNGARAYRLRGRVDAAVLERALELIVERHEVLRTVYVVEAREPKQQPLEAWSVSLPIVDLASLPPAERERETERRLRELSREPFDLTTDLMLRATLFRLGPEEHVLLIRLHHIAFDAFSDGIFLGELSSAYSMLSTGEEPDLPELPIQYADFAVWQREHLAGPRMTELVDYWRSALGDAPSILRLPTDGPRRLPQRHEGRHRPVSLPGHLMPAITALGRAEGATPYMVLLAAFTVLLYRISGQDDVVVGTPIANRGQLELQSLVGFFSNTVAMRIRLNGNPSFREVLARARDTAVGAYAHQELPFERVVEELHAPRDPRFNPVFQVNFRAQAEERKPLELVGLEVEPISIDIGFSRFDLALELRFEPDAITGYIEYDLDLFEDSTIDGLAQELASTLEQLLAEPDRTILELNVQPRWLRSSPPPMKAPRRAATNREQA
jgi:hypothetical protein